MRFLFALFFSLTTPYAHASLIQKVTHQLVEALDYDAKVDLSEESLIEKLTGLSPTQIQNAEDGFAFSRRLVPIRLWKTLIDLVPFDSFVHYEQTSWVRQNPLLNVFWGTAINTSPDVIARFSITHDATSIGSESSLATLIGPLHRSHTSDTITHLLAPLKPHLDSLQVEVIELATPQGKIAHFVKISGLNSKKRNGLFSLQLFTSLIHRLQDQHFQRTHDCEGIL